ncbi:MAG: hypothetical protein ACI9TH_003989 [Kiritimatiellia bacterium]|jgi:hypothetical protein
MKKWMCVLMLALFAGCGSKEPEPEPEVGVQWPELKALDALSIGAEMVLESGDQDRLQQVAKELKAAAIALADAPVPSNAKNVNEVTLLVASVKELAATLDVAEHLPKTVPAFHPIVEALMEAAGVPHTHDVHDHGHDDHDGHDGHDHDGHDH